MHIIFLALLVSPAVPLAALEAAPAAEDAAPETVAAQLRQGLAYWQAGDFARARTVFETALRLDDLPPDVHQQADVYAGAARAWLDGQPVVATGYAVASLGHYAEHGTIAGVGAADDMFGGLRIGGRVNGSASARLAINASVDYRFRGYGDPGRRDDSDLRWVIGGSRALRTANLGFGIRGRISDRGGGITRNDAGVYADLRWAPGDDDQLTTGIELRRRSYPYGPLRYRSRDIVELTAGWSHALAAGRASFTLAAHGGHEFALPDNPYGDSNFIGLSLSVDLTISDRLAAYGFGWWQRGRYNRELLESGIADAGGIGPRNDTLLEVGGGLVWGFAPGWEVGPSVLHLRDRSSLTGYNYSSTEVQLTLRRDF